MFLDSIRERQLEEERKRKEEDGVELASFREFVWSNCAEVTLAKCLYISRAVAARSGPPPPPIPMSSPNTQKPEGGLSKPKPPAVKKDTKKSLKGVVVKKRPKAPEKMQKKDGGSKPDSLAVPRDSPDKEDGEKRPKKKQKLE